MKMEIYFKFFLLFSDSFAKSHSGSKGLSHTDPNLPARQEQLCRSILRELLLSPDSTFLALHFLKAQQKTGKY